MQTKTYKNVFEELDDIYADGLARYKAYIAQHPDEDDEDEDDEQLDIQPHNNAKTYAITRDSGKYIMDYDDREGYTIISPKGIRYDLLEGRSYRGDQSLTSDIVFIIEMNRNGTYKELVEFVYGADVTEGCLETCAEVIEGHEAGRKPSFEF